MSRKTQEPKLSRRARRKMAAEAPVFVAPPMPNFPESLPLPSIATLSTFVPATPEPKLSRRALKKINANAVRSFEELLAALEAKNIQITLGEDIMVEKSIVIDYDVAINFNGHNLVSDQNQHDFRLIDIRRGEVTLTGEGKIFAFGTGSVAVRVFGAISSGLPNYTTLTIDERIQLFAPDGSGILVSANLGAAYGVTVNFSGLIIARSGICLGQGVRGTDGNLPVINVKNGSSIVADDTCAAAIEAAGLGIWHIGATKLYGLSGLWAKLGEIHLEHTRIFSVSTSIKLDGPDGANINFSAQDGIYLSATDFVVAGNPRSIANITLADGEYAGARGVLSDEILPVAKLDGGEYGSDVRTAWSDYAAGIAFPVVEADFEDESPEELSTSESSDVLVLPVAEASTEETSEKSAEETTEKSSEQLAEKTIDKSAEQPAKSTSKPSKSTKKSSTKSTKSTKSAKSTKVSESTKADAATPVKAAPIVYAPLNSAPVKTFDIIASPITLNPSASAQPAFQPTAAPVQPAPTVSTPVMPTPVAPPDERAALIESFSEAVATMRTLKSTDYDASFMEFEAALTNTEQILNDPAVDLAEITAAAATMLEAFDNLREREDISLSDDELDQLFYHGAVLQEVAKTPDADLLDFNALEADDFDDFDEVLFDQPEQVAPITADNIADIVAATFSAEDEGASPVPEEGTARPFFVKKPSTAPVSTNTRPALIDEMSPSAQWSTGVTLIDELAPVVYSGPALPFRSRFSTSVRNFCKSLASAFRAGIAAFHTSRAHLRIQKI